LGFPDEIDFSDSTDATVQKVNRIYATSLMFVLTNYPWRFVLKRVSITASQTDAGDTSKYKYNYVLPVQALAIRTLYTDANYSCPIKEFESTPKVINTDASTVYVWYISQIDEEDFPQYFIDYFKYKLALDLCFNLTGDTDLIQLLQAKETAQLISSKNIDSKQNKVRTIRSSPFTQIRS